MIDGWNKAEVKSHKSRILLSSSGQLTKKHSLGMLSMGQQEIACSIVLHGSRAAAVYSSKGIANEWHFSSCFKIEVLQE